MVGATDPASIRALDLSQGLPPNPKNLQRVAAETNPDAARWAFSQWELRKRAQTKHLPHASELLLTKEALEQATHYEIARYHAGLFPPGALVADLTTGVGSDLIAMAERGPVRGYEIERERYECAVYNCFVCGAAAEVVNRDCLAGEWDFEYAVADPARRVAGKRTSDPAEFEPNPALLSARMASLKLGIIKLSPLLPDEFLRGLGPGLQFVSFGGECREALVLCGQEAPSGRWAVMVGQESLLEERQISSEAQVPDRFLYEADPAVIRAHAMGSLPGADAMSLLGDSNGYLTSSVESASPWVKSYRVVDSGRFDLKQVRASLRELGRGCRVVKSRAKGVEAETLLKQIRCAGNAEAILVLYAVEKSVRYALVEPFG